MTVVVDTDVASALLRRRTPEGIAHQLAGETIAITFVTFGEDFADFAEHEGLELVR